MRLHLKFSKNKLKRISMTDLVELIAEFSLSLDIICSSKLTVFLELHSRETVRFSEQVMSAEPFIFSRQKPHTEFQVLWPWHRDIKIFFPAVFFVCITLYYFFLALSLLKSNLPSINSSSDLLGLWLKPYM